MSCTRAAMITFSSMPFARATRALCSMCCTSLRKIRSRKKSARVGRSGIFGSAGLSPIITRVRGPRATSERVSRSSAAGVPIKATVGGIMSSRFWSTASSRGSLSQLTRPASRSDAGISFRGTCWEGSSVGASVGRPLGTGTSLGRSVGTSVVTGLVMTHHLTGAQFLTPRSCLYYHVAYLLGRSRQHRAPRPFRRSGRPLGTAEPQLGRAGARAGHEFVQQADEEGLLGLGERLRPRLLALVVRAERAGDRFVAGGGEGQ